MNLHVSAPAFLPFLLLVLGPLLVHLLARARPPVYHFSSIELIRRMLRSSQRIKKPQDWILLVLRTLFIGFLLLVFLQPLLFSRLDLAALGGQRNAVLIVDASASMALREGGASRFADACAEASSVLSGLNTRDRANLIWLRTPAEAVFPELGVNHRSLHDALRQAQVTLESGDPRDGLRLAVEMLKDAEGKKEIYLFSDFQATAWSGFDPELPSDIDVITVALDGIDGENVAVTDLRVEPAMPLAGEAVRLYARVNNFSPRARRGSVYLEAGEKREKQDVLLEPWSETTLILPFSPSTPGVMKIAAELDTDEFSGDNRREAVVEVRPFLRVGLLEDERDTAHVWRQVLDALGWVQVEPIHLSQSSEEDPFDAILLAGWSGDHSDVLKKHLEQGTTLLWYPAKKSSFKQLADVIGGTVPDVPFRWEQTRDAHSLEVVAADDALFSLFARGEYGDPASARFQGRFGMTWPGWTRATVLMQYEDGVPALMRIQDKGQVILWNLSLSEDAGTLASHPELIVLMGELLLGGRSGGASDGFSLLNPGERPALRRKVEALVSEIELLAPNGEAREVYRQDANQGGHFYAERIETPGVYTWTMGDDVLGHSVVQFPVRESDLRSLPAEALQKKVWVNVVSGDAVRELKEGRRLWPLMLMAALGLLLTESAVSVWAAKS